MRPEDLAAAMDLPAEKSTKVIRWLLDHEKLLYDDAHKLLWKR
jgi:hypothetical protein